MDNKNSPPEFHKSFYGPRYWTTWLLLGFFRFLSVLPVPVGLALGRVLGDLFYLVARSRRHIAEVNVALCFPHLSAQEQDRLVREIMRSTGKSIVETSIALWGPANRFKNRYTIHGFEHVEAAKARGQGILLLGCHLMTLDAAARVFAFHSSYDVLYRKDDNALLAYAIRSARMRFVGNTIVRSDTRQMIKNLRQGHIVWYAPDQDYGPKHSVFAPFFGIPAATVVATTRIAMLGKAAVLPYSHYRDENNHYHLIVEAPLEGYPSGDEVADATRINHIFEKVIAAHPDQYLWVHRRFKTRPEGEPNFYAKK